MTSVPPAAAVVPKLYISGRYDACVFCGRVGYVEADHVRPVSAGGEDIPVNLAPLCPMCNLIKSDFWADTGEIIYHPFTGLDDVQLAWAILHTEIDWLTGRFDRGDVNDHIWVHYTMYPGGALGGWDHA